MVADLIYSRACAKCCPRCQSRVSRLNWRALLIAFFLLLPGTDSLSAELGINTPGVGDYSPQLVFVDVFKAARPWCTRNVDGTGPWNSEVAVPMRIDGYPIEVPFTLPGGTPQIVHTLMVREIQGHYPAGTYTFSFQGEGRIELAYDSGNHVLTKPGTYKIPVRPSDAGIALTIVRSQRSNPIRNIRMIMPGFEGIAQSQPFYPPFIESLKPFKVIRFMDFQHINNSVLAQWRDRKKPNFAIQSGEDGVALEYLIDLCNLTGLDPWFNIPHLANNDFAYQFGRLVRRRLDPKRTVYIEYSNELWNNLFRQAGWVQQQGLAAGLAGSDGFQAGLRFAAMRSLQLFRAMASGMGNSHPLVTILSSQAANFWTGQQMLEVVGNPELNPYGVKIDALAIAPYVGNGIADKVAALGLSETITVAEILQRLQDDLEQETLVWIIKNRKVADEHGVRLFAYEAGQHLVAANITNRNNESLTSKLIAANRNPGMKDVYCRLFDLWRQQGGDLFMPFSLFGRPTKYGSWGLLEWLGQPRSMAPKYDAILDCWP